MSTVLSSQWTFACRSEFAGSSRINWARSIRRMDGAELGIGDFDAFGVLVPIQLGADLEPRVVVVAAISWTIVR